MFLRATQCNGDLSQWNASKVTNMSGMFEGANQFHENLRGCDSSSDKYESYVLWSEKIQWGNARNMDSMFDTASILKCLRH
jgi:surface protein